MPVFVALLIVIRRYQACTIIKICYMVYMKWQSQHDEN